MGMYTEILVKCDIMPQAPQEVRDVLGFLFNNDEHDALKLPDHPFFKADRWSFIGNSSSYYHIPWSVSKYESDRVFSRSDLKNYCGSIELFWNWITPYIDEPDGKCVGWHWYEECDIPTLVIKGEK